MTLLQLQNLKHPSEIPMDRQRDSRLWPLTSRATKLSPELFVLFVNSSTKIDAKNIKEPAFFFVTELAERRRYWYLSW